MIHLRLPFVGKRKRVEAAVKSLLPERLEVTCCSGGGQCSVTPAGQHRFLFKVESDRPELSSHGDIYVAPQTIFVDVIPAVRQIERYEKIIRQVIADEVLPVLG